MYNLILKLTLNLKRLRKRTLIWHWGSICYFLAQIFVGKRYQLVYTIKFSWNTPICYMMLQCVSWHKKNSHTFSTKYNKEKIESYWNFKKSKRFRVSQVAIHLNRESYPITDGKISILLCGHFNYLHKIPFHWVYECCRTIFGVCKKNDWPAKPDGRSSSTHFFRFF